MLTVTARIPGTQLSSSSPNIIASVSGAAVQGKNCQARGQPCLGRLHRPEGQSAEHAPEHRHNQEPPAEWSLCQGKHAERTEHGWIRCDSEDLGLAPIASHQCGNGRVTNQGEAEDRDTEHAPLVPGYPELQSPPDHSSSEKQQDLDPEERKQVDCCPI